MREAPGEQLGNSLDAHPLKTLLGSTLVKFARQTQESELTLVKERTRGLQGSNLAKFPRHTLFEAVGKDWRALEFAAKELRGDREFAFAAVAKGWRALELAAKELRVDREVVLAMCPCGLALTDFSARSVNFTTAPRSSCMESSLLTMRLDIHSSLAT